MDARITEFPWAVAKARLFEMVDRAEAGEEIVIKRHGTPVVRLMPITPDDRRRAEVRQTCSDYVTWVRANGTSLGPDITIRQLIDEGRRF